MFRVEIGSSPECVFHDTYTYRKLKRKKIKKKEKEEEKGDWVVSFGPEGVFQVHARIV